jgi:Domain of unknown function (DUF4194)
MHHPDQIQHELSLALITLMKGVTERDANPVAWQALQRSEGAVRDHAAVLGLDLRLDETEGFAYLVQRATVDGEPDLPRLVPRRQLSYPVSLLLALLRKKLVEFDATSGDRRLIMSREAIIELIRLFLPETTNQVALEKRVTGAINSIIELGFLRVMRGQPEQFEVQRILTAFIDAQWLSGLAERLEDYRRHGAGQEASQDTDEGVTDDHA